MLTKADFKPYQEWMTQKLIDLPFCALWADMGLGKTVTTLTACEDLLDTCQADKILVVSTCHNVDVTWPDEPKEWEHLQHIEIVPIRGTPAKRLELLKHPSPYHTINVEGLKWLTSLYPIKRNRKTGERRTDWPYDVVVLDESGLFRKYDTNRFKALKRLRPFIKRMIQLTGTPAPKGLTNLWSQAYLLDGGERLGRTLTSFRQRWFTKSYDGFNWEPNMGAEHEITSLLADICFTLKREDYVTLPPVTVNPIICKIPPARMAEYREFEKESVQEFGGEIIDADNAGVLHGRLLQLAGGAIYIDDQHNFHEFHDKKLDILADLVDEASGKPMIVAYNFKSDKIRMQKRFPKMVFLADHKKDSKDLVRRWNNDEIEVLGLNPKSAAHGLNLQKGHAAGITWFSLTPDLELWMQLNGRLDRTGQRYPTVNNVIVAEGTVDEKTVDSLSAKDATQASITEAFRCYVNAFGSL